MTNLLPPTSYQGGKQRISKNIVDIILKDNENNIDFKIYDLCCGSGAISLELINRGINPEKIVMCDMGVYGDFWDSISKNTFNLDIFRQELEKLPEIGSIQNYLQELSKNKVNPDLKIYHYLLMQAGSFGSKQIWIENDSWKNTSFRSYWKPTETSNRKSPVNPMMPMPETIYNRVENIYDRLNSKINVYNVDLNEFDLNINKNDIIYIDPPYINTTGYGFNFDYNNFISRYKHNKIYISEGISLPNMENILISKGRAKGNINGKVNKKSTNEWLNIYS